MLRKCTECGKFFGPESDDQMICSSCSAGPNNKYNDISDPEQKKFKAARDVVYEFPDISPQEVVEKLTEMDIEITHREIMGYVKDGRLTLTNVPDGHFCEDCGRVILSGRLCPRCANSLEKNITQRNVTKPVSTVVVDNERKSGMHTANEVKKR